MRVFFIILLVASASYSQTSTTQPAATLEQALGKEKIQTILKDVVVKSLPEVKANFWVTDQSMVGLESSGVPVTFSSKLKDLKGQEIVGRENLVAALSTKMGKEDTATYQRLVAFYTQSIVVVTDDFYSRIEKLVLRSAPPTSLTAEKWLETGFQQFIADYTAFLRQNSPDKSTVVIGFRLEEFLKIAASKCGKLPCDVPPCCGKAEEFCAEPCKNP